MAVEQQHRQAYCRKEANLGSERSQMVARLRVKTIQHSESTAPAKPAMFPEVFGDWCQHAAMNDAALG
jgi:hypothetical protein